MAEWDHSGGWAQESSVRAATGFTGPYCDGTEAELALKQPVQGVLDPGQWAYYTLELAAVDQMWQQNGIELDFVANGGHPVLLAKQGAYPTLLDNDVRLQTPQLKPRSTYRSAHNAAAHVQAHQPAPR